NGQTVIETAVDVFLVPFLVIESNMTNVRFGHVDAEPRVDRGDDRTFIRDAKPHAVGRVPVTWPVVLSKRRWLRIDRPRRVSPSLRFLIREHVESVLQRVPKSRHRSPPSSYPHPLKNASTTKIAITTRQMSA